MQSRFIIQPVTPEHDAAWRPLWQGYQRFYQTAIPSETTQLTWQRLHYMNRWLNALGLFNSDRCFECAQSLFLQAIVGEVIRR